MPRFRSGLPWVSAPSQAARRLIDSQLPCHSVHFLGMADS
jgi:hypothetical protein